MGMNTDAVQRLYVAYFNRPADPASLAVYEAMLPSDREATQAELEALAETYFSPSQEYADLYSGMSNAQIVNQMYQNLFGRDAEPAGLLHWTGKLIDGSESFASIALQLTYSAQGSDAAAIDAKISAATAFTTEVASSTDNIVGYSGNAAAASARTWLATVTDEATASVAITNVVGAVSDAVNATDAVSGQTYQLQVGQDVITAGNGGDTFDGVANSNNGALATLTTIDRIDGGGGSDTVILNSGALTDLTLSALTSIEKIVTNAGTTLGAPAQAGGVVEVETSGRGGLTLASGYTNDAVTFTALAAQTDQVDFQNLTAGTNVRVTLDPSAVGNNSIGMFDVQTEDTAGALTGGISKFDDEGTILRSTTDATVVFDVRDTAGNSLGNYREVHLGTVAADTVTAGAGISVYAAGGTGNDQLTGSTAADYLDGGAGNDAITANAGNNNAAGGAGNDTISATTGTDTLDGGAGNDQIDGGAGNDQLAGGDGNDSITIGTGTDNASGGEGNDTIVAGANLGNDTIAGGNGNDVMTVNALGTGGDALFANTTSVETLTLATGSSTIGSAAQAAGVTTVNLDTAGANNDVLAATGFSTGLTVNIGTGNDNIGLGSGGDTLVAGTGELTTNDTVAFNAGNDTVSASGSNTLDLDDITGLESVVVTGTTGNDTAAVEFDTITATTVQTITVDASALNGASDTLALTQGGGGGGTRFDVTGAAGNDTLAGNANADTIDGGAGNDQIDGGAGNDQIEGGAGNDQLTLSAGTDNASGGEGNDTIVAGANLGNDTIAGGNGNDVMTVNALGTGGDALFANTTSVETLTLATGSSTIGSAAQAAGVTTVNLDTAGANNDVLAATGFSTGLTVNIGTGNDNIGLGSGGDTLVAGTGELTTNDTVAFNAGNDTVSASGSNTLDLDDITGLESVVVTGTTGNDTAAVEFDTITATTVQTITVDASALNGASDTLALTQGGGGGGTRFDVTGAAGNDTLTTNANADTIDGGAGNDSITSGNGANQVVGGAGNDNIVLGTGNDDAQGGTGNDSITSGTGNDTINGGAGSDTITMGANFTFDDQIDGGADTDTLSVTTLTTDGDIKFLQTSNIEAVTLTAAGSNTIGARAQSSGVTTVTMSGAGAETLTATAYTTGLTVNMGATNGDRVATGTGNDSVVGSATTTFDPTDTITLGTGNDTISVAGAANSLDLDNVTGLESIVFVNTTAADTMRLDLSAITTSTDSSVTIDGSALTTTGDNIDLNNGGGGTTSYVITGSVGNDNLEGGAVADTISGGSAGNDTVTTNAGNDSVTTAGGNDSVSGNTGNNHIVTGAGTDTITATTGNDTIDAGAGNDAITGGTGMDKLTGGAGADTFTVGTEASTFIYDTITDFATGVGGDTISGLHTGASTAAETFNSTAISLGSNATFQDYLDEGAKTTGTEGEISWFQFNGNTYLVQDNNAATTFVAGSDIVVEITGLVDLSGGTPGDGSFGP